MAYWHLYYHIVWATKERMPLISTSIEERLYKYIIDKSKALKCKIHIINGMPDHIHVIVSIPPTIIISEYVRKIKASSSNFIGKNYNNSFYWQDGYGIFSVGVQNLPIAINYVKNQKQHHQNKTTITELEKFSP
ncbi:transposase [Cyanobacterium sp. HL-69]|uniref:IS200/IS605 family transposase n=1 Tax=Cyanobacterium sp. HL-69 TaxID=2054282 RepID=UPI000CA1FF4B|nr:transposase [Cyanobacterium sp. HL-69]